MKHTTATKNILTHGKNAFRALNYAKGFDFEKPIFIYEGSGNFTLNGLKTITEATGIDTKTAAICVIIYKVDRWNEHFRVVDICPGFSGFQLFETRDLGFFNNSRDINSYWRKSDFDSDRKEKEITFYIIAQNAEFLQQPKKEAKINFAERVEVVDDCHYKQNGKKVYISDNIGYYNRREKRTFDKSGYLLNNIRNDLKRQAAAIRASRQKAAADIYNAETETNTIKARYKNLKNKLAEMLLNGEIDKVYKGICNFKWVTNDIANFENKIKNKAFCSIDEIKQKIKRINDDIDKIYNQIA